MGYQLSRFLFYRSLRLQHVTRNFSVKELPWCTSDSTSKDLKRKVEWAQTKPEAATPCSSCNTIAFEEKSSTTSLQSNAADSIVCFNIIAAMNQNRVIGVDGRLPWTIPNDRLQFEALTNEKVLIIGRHTLFETQNFSHLRHLRHVIVVSTTLDDATISNVTNKIHPVKVHLAHSFEESLRVAKSLERRNHDAAVKDIDCWIGGGQRLYEHAIRHVAANEIYLTLVNENSIQKGDVSTSFFPAKYRWDNVFLEVAEKTKIVSEDHDVDFSYTYFTYRKRRKTNEHFTT